MSSALEAGLILEKFRELRARARRPYRRRFYRRSYRRPFGRSRFSRFRGRGRGGRRWYWRRVPVPPQGIQEVPLYVRMARPGFVYDPARNRFLRAPAPANPFAGGLPPMAYRSPTVVK